MHDGEDFSLVTRSSDGQMLFLANMLSKMKHDTPLGSRIAEVHNGSSLFTGDAGQGESNIRRWVIENDWLEAIVALPLNMFYNTDIATYIWVITNRKGTSRQGRIQLIDARSRFQPLRRNLGKKNCELSPDNIEWICRVFLTEEESADSKFFDNRAFGFWEVPICRPQRLHSRLDPEAFTSLRFASGDRGIRQDLHAAIGDRLFTDFEQVRGKLESILESWNEDEGEENGSNVAGENVRISERRKKRIMNPGTWKRDARLYALAELLRDELGDQLYEDHNIFRDVVRTTLKKHGQDVTLSDLKAIFRAVSWRVETAPPVVKRVLSSKKAPPDPLHGLYERNIEGTSATVEYEPDNDIRDFELVPLLEPDGLDGYIAREVITNTPDAWIDLKGVKIGYNLHFERHFERYIQPTTTGALEAMIVQAAEAAQSEVVDYFTPTTEHEPAE